LARWQYNRVHGGSCKHGSKFLGDTHTPRHVAIALPVYALFGD
jgi:hypothetical protein